MKRLTARQSDDRGSVSTGRYSVDRLGMKFRYRRNPTAETVAVALVFLIALVGSTVYFTRNAEGPASPSDEGSWHPVPSGVTSTLLDIDFVDPEHGWAVGQDGTIIATSDGGETWQKQVSGFELTIRGVDFIDTRTGWAVGHLGLILHTTDGGQNWSFRGHEAALGLNLIHVGFSSPGVGWIVTEQGGFTLRSSDGGETWVRQPFGSAQARSDAFILDNNRSWVALTSGGVISTANSGASWDQHKGINQVEIGASGIFFLDERRGWVAGWRGKQRGITSGVQFVKYLTDGMVAYTTDGGETWTRVDADTGKFLWDVVFIDAQEGWAVGSSGQTMHSTDGGRTWSPEPPATDSILRAITFSDSNTAWAVGENGAILKLTRE